MKIPPQIAKWNISECQFQHLLFENVFSGWHLNYSKNRPSTKSPNILIKTKILTTTKMLIFWIVLLKGCRAKDGDTMFLRNFGSEHGITSPKTLSIYLDLTLTKSSRKTLWHSPWNASAYILRPARTVMRIQWYSSHPSIPASVTRHNFARPSCWSEVKVCIDVPENL